MFKATAEGFRAARRNGRLIVVTWLFGLLLAAAAAFPVRQALVEATALLPHADALAQGFSAEIVADLVELRPGLMGGLGAAAASAFGLALLLGLIVSGGALEVLTSPDDERPFAHRFGRGAFRFFGRFLRLGMMTGLLAALCAALLGGPIVALAGRLRRDSGSEWLALGVQLAALLVVALVVLLALLVQDAARVRIVREDERRARKALRAGFGIVLRNKLAWFGAWKINALVLLVVFAAYLGLVEAIPAGRALLATVLLQQLFVLSRCALRVALLGAEVALVPPLPPPAPIVEPPPTPAPEPEPQPA